MKRVLVVVVVAVLFAPSLAAQSVGGGLSVFVPESLYAGAEGSVSVETAFSTSLSLGGVLSIPVGVAYNQVYGLTPRSSELSSARRPWFYGDNIHPYVTAKARFGIDRFFVDVYGGGGLSWNPVLRPLWKNIEQDLAGALADQNAESISFVSDSLSVNNRLGYGWVAGGGFGLNVQGVDVDISVTYRSMRHDIGISGDYYNVETGAGPQSFSSEESLADFTVLLRGLAVGIGGSVEM